MSKLHLIDLDLNVIAQAFDPTEMSEHERNLVLHQALSGARAMFEAKTPDEREKAKLEYLRAALFASPQKEA